MCDKYYEQYLRNCENRVYWLRCFCCRAIWNYHGFNTHNAPDSNSLRAYKDVGFGKLYLDRIILLHNLIINLTINKLLTKLYCNYEQLDAYNVLIKFDYQ